MAPHAASSSRSLHSAAARPRVQLVQTDASWTAAPFAASESEPIARVAQEDASKSARIESRREKSKRRSKISAREKLMALGLAAGWLLVALLVQAAPPEAHRLKLKRQAVNETVNRLHILESLDGQLRSFSAALEPLQSAGGQRVCSLPLRAPVRPATCLQDDQLRAQVPPYMLNLYRQLLAAINQQAPVRHLPYNARLMRSFRQPLPAGAHAPEVVVELGATRSPEVGVLQGSREEQPASCGRWRAQPCFWFRLGEHFSARINGSLVEGRARRESLKEAELHVFKLAPEVAQRRRNQLKTNLLEVSAHQVLEDNALRLLDIRRIDLDSSGWETFYVKRAVQDWTANARSNLGLVITAKSMFEEPIRAGLVRFADAHKQPEVARAKLEREHQPTLVVYTSLA